jgi:hypothetical protein
LNTPGISPEKYKYCEHHGKNATHTTKECRVINSEHKETARKKRKDKDHVINSDGEDSETWASDEDSDASGEDSDDKEECGNNMTAMSF